MKIDGKWGFIDKNGKEVVSPRYQLVKDFSEGLAAVEINDKWGFVDKTGKVVISPRYHRVEDFKEGIAAVKTDGERGWKWGFIDKNGKEVVSPRFDNIYSCFVVHVDFPEFHEERAVVMIDDKMGVIDKTGREVVPTQYDYISDYKDGLAYVRLGECFCSEDKCFMIDKSGIEMFTLKYNWIRILPFSEGLAAVEIDDKWGFIDKKGKEVVSPRFESANSFSEGLSAVRIDGKWGFIDKNGREVIPPRFKEASSFNEGLAIVEVNSDDIVLFEEKKKLVQATWNKCNQQLMEYPYNTEKLQLESVSLKKYFFDPRLETITDSIVAELNQKTKDLQEDCYKKLKSNQPEKFAGIYLQLHPEAKSVLENLKLECRCKNYSEAELVIKIADNTVPQCTCRNDYWNQYGNLFSSRAEFDNTYNTSEQGFLDDVKLRQNLKADIQEIASMLSGLKAPKFKDGLTGKNEDIIKLLQKVQYHQGKYYYDEVVEMMFAADAAMTKEWEKNGSLFSSRNEFYEAYVSGDYKNVLKEKKSK